MSKRADVAVVGGGITGLAAAYRLQRLAPELNVILIEASDRLGGKIATEAINGFVLEGGPDCFLSHKPRGVGLCQELGLAARLQGRDPAYNQSYVLRHGRLHRLPAGLTGLIPSDLKALSGSTLLSAAARARLAQERELPPAPDSGDESVAHFITRRFGRELFENLIEPLMGGIYAGQADQLSLAATFPQLRQLELKHGSLLAGLADRPAGDGQAYPPFVAFPQGMGELVEQLIERLSGVTIWLNTAVTRIEKRDGGYLLAVQRGERPPLPGSPAGETLLAPAVIVTAPAFAAGRLLERVDETIATALAEIPYAATALVNLAFDESDAPGPLDGYGYVIPAAEGREALACTWSSRKWAGRAPAGKLLLRVYVGRYGRPDATRYSNERLLQIALDELGNTLGIQAPPLLHRIHRWPQALPQYTLGHLERLAVIEERLGSHPGLFLAGAAFRGVGIPDCIDSGETAARQAAAFRLLKFRKLQKSERGSR
ncbi:MAG: protoporphyrinogen oxidase [Chloroflexi bacterium]|nr:protoporphyrinogen oxidase [Chloroflexota bacterium]MCI0580463.1 protoporphyrinogen oxidase [Chloroflexota bacterium]MCI0649207.1 protoporphyrinogen oxidase [Chloroflexota bacterium]MCI0727981.1 protoporphyrinogen oxidase [Chloroflexota bacterium]